MALYHKHRPQTFDSVIGQDHVVKTIKQQIKHNRIAHAYLFSGPRGVGKTTTARLLAKAVNCPAKDGSPEPDNDSECAREINESRCIDVLEIDAASHTGVDNVRQNIIENAQFKPTKCAKKVFIIDEVHMLSTAAFNALLKTLEEPPSHVLFILATTEIHKLPLTIISRCQRFAFKKVLPMLIARHLEDVAKIEQVTVDAEVLRRIAKKSDGCVRDAISMFDQIASQGDRHITLKDISFILPHTTLDRQIAFIASLLENDAQKALSCISSIVEDGVHIERFMEELMELARYCMLHFTDSKLAEDGMDLNSSESLEFKKMLKNTDAQTFVRLIDQLMKRKNQVSSSPITELPLEMLVIEWCNKMPTPDELPKRRTKAIDTPMVASQESAEKKSANITAGIEIRENPTTHVPGISKSSLLSIWPKILTEVDKLQPSLGSLLKMVRLTDIRGNQLFVTTAYDFHKEKLSEFSCKAKIEDMIERVLGQRLILNIELSDTADNTKNTQELRDLATAFGGEIVL